jgi:hypothetical protein
VREDAVSTAVDVLGVHVSTERVVGDTDVAEGDFSDAPSGSLGQAVKERLPPGGVLIACFDKVDEGVGNFHGEALGVKSIARKTRQ